MSWSAVQPLIDTAWRTYAVVADAEDAPSSAAAATATATADMENFRFAHFPFEVTMFD
jgi:hypothetical protein